MKTQLNDKEIKLSKNIFSQLMTEVFGNNSNLYDLLFKRFKIAKYEVKTENYKDQNRERDCLYVADISHEEKEIDIYEISLALGLIMKSEFEEKLQCLFDITDVDGDGYINQVEIKNIINTAYFIFSDEECSLPTGSSIVNHSLATIKAQQVIDKLFFYVKFLYKFLARGTFKSNHA
jgi:Ca2+-binding EF-hand superfamily protein